MLALDVSLSCHTTRYYPEDSMYGRDIIIESLNRDSVVKQKALQHSPKARFETQNRMISQVCVLLHSYTEINDTR